MEKQTPTTPQFTTSTSHLPRPPIDHEKALDTLENDFKRMDKMFASGEMRVFGKVNQIYFYYLILLLIDGFFFYMSPGRNSDSMFKELDLIHKKQVSLAIEHISLERLPDEEM